MRHFPGSVATVVSVPGCTRLNYCGRPKAEHAHADHWMRAHMAMHDRQSAEKDPDIGCTDHGKDADWIKGATYISLKHQGKKKKT